MTWRVIGQDVNGRPTYHLGFPSSTAWGVVQELSGRWAWELNMPNPADDQRGRADTRAEAQARVEIAAGQRGLVQLERIVREQTDAAQVAALGGHNGST